MEIKNAKMDWNLILNDFISYTESKFPDFPVKKYFEPIVEKLTNNQLRSRVLVSGREVAAYAYIVDSEDAEDRFYVTAGFLQARYYSEERLLNIVNWVLEESKKDKKIPILSEVFNGQEGWEAVIQGHGFRKMVRTRMRIDLHNREFPITDVPQGVTLAPFSKISPEEYAKLAFEAYKGTEDAILYSSTLEQSMDTAVSLFNGDYGRIIPEASFAVMLGERLAGCIIFTNGDGPKAGDRVPLLADVDLLPELRGKGIGKTVLIRSLSEMSRIGYMKAVLWVSDSNSAKGLYRSVGFSDGEQPSDSFYYVPPT